MFLKELELRNVKCHEQLKLSFTCNDKKNPIRKTTFLLGENGTGKSALLKAIALITSGSSSLGDILGTPNDWIRNKKPYCEIKAVITTQKGEERPISLKIQRDHTLAQIIVENRESLERIDGAISNADRNYFVVGYGASRRLNRGGETFFKSSQQFTSPRSSNIQTLFNPDASLVSLANWAMELDYARGKSGLETVKKALNQFLVDGVKFKTINRKEKKMLFTTPDGDLPLEQLSDGYQNVIAWVGDLMYNVTTTFQDYKDPLKARGLLLIDEIDLHLHPKWQRLLHKFLWEKLPNFQVVATTHSPLTAQQAEEGELYALKREAKKVELVPFEGAPSKMLLHQLLMSPVFGLPTDESLRVQKAKEEVREVHLKANPTKAEKAKAEESAKQLATLPVNIRSNSLLSESELQMLKTINAQLKEKSQKK